MTSRSLATFTRERLTKAARSRTRDATFSAVGGTLRSLASSTLSLLQGVEKRGWAVGVDGQTVRMLDTSPASLLGQLSLNEIVYACMRERMKVLISPAFLVERRQPDGTYVVDHEHELTGLLRRPGPNLDTATLWRCLEASYSSIGRLYIEPIRGSASGALRGLNPLNPVYITERYEDGQLVSYDWRPPDGPVVIFAPDQLIVRRAVDWADVPPLIAALGSVEADQLSNDFMRGFFSNAGVPSGIVKVRGSWSETLTDAFRVKWMERFGPSGMAAGGPAIFDENIESYTRLGVSLNELDNETLRMFIETRICMCFGVPPLIIYAYAGLLKATYSNLQEAWSSFWDATALPLLKEWAEWINWSLLTLYEDADDVLLGIVRCRFDPSGLGPYQEDVDAKITLYRDAYDAGAVTMNELRAVMGLAAHPDGDIFKAPPAPPVPWQVPPSTPPVTTGDEPATGATKALPPGQVPSFLHIRDTKAAPKPSARLDADVTKYLKDQYAKARRLWIAGNNQGADAVIREIGEQLDSGIALFGVLGPHERKAYGDSWKSAAQRIDFPAVIDSGDVTSAVDLLAERCKGISDTTKQEITDLILKGATEQQTDAEIAAALAELGFERSTARAPLITRTELAVASSTAARDAYQASGVVSELEWLTGPDPCPDCQARDGKRYPLDSAPELPAHPACVCDMAPILAEVLA